MNISIFNLQRDLKISKSFVKAIVTSVLSLEQCTYDEVSIHFVTIKRIAELHQQYFNDPSPTDCISFPMDNLPDQPTKVLGDIFICPKVAIQYAKKHGRNPHEELALYVVHGMLHLLGYDDIDPKQRQQMRRAERRHLKAILSNYRTKSVQQKR